MFIRNLLYGTRPAPPILERQGKEVCKVVGREIEGEERGKALVAGGYKILEEGRDWGIVDWHQFTLMHNASSLSDTPYYRGGYLGDNCRAWKQIFTLWKEGKGHFTTPKLTKEQIQAVLEGLDSLSDAHEYISTLRSTYEQAESPKRGEILERGAEQFLDNIKKKCREKGRVYLPLNYRGGAMLDGHDLVGKVVQHKGFVTVRIFNQGEGSSHHPLLGYTATQERPSYCFFPIKIANEVFYGDMGQALFCHLFRFTFDPPDSSLPKYTSIDIYDLFLLIGELIPDLGPNPEKYAVNPQVNSDCSNKAPKNVVRDILIDMEVSRSDLQVVFVNVHLCSLVKGYHTYIKSPQQKYLKLLYKGAEETGFLAQKIKGVLTKEEMGAVVALLGAILETKCRDSPAETREACQRQNLESELLRVENPVDTFPIEEGILVEGVEVERVDSVPTSQSEVHTASTFQPPTFSLENALEDISSWIKQLKTLPSAVKFGYFTECIYLLPIPDLSSDEDIWDRLTIEDGKKLLQLLKKLYIEGDRSIPEEERSIFKYDEAGEFAFTLLYTLFAIADHVARKNPETKLKGFASPFPYISEGFEFVLQGRENIRFHKIREYFRARKREATKGVIFPPGDSKYEGEGKFSYKLKIEEDFEEYQKNHSIKNSEIAHLIFLSQFFPSNSSKKDLLPKLVAYWVSPQDFPLPEEVWTLDFFASRFDISQEHPPFVHLRYLSRSQLPLTRKEQKSTQGKLEVIWEVLLSDDVEIRSYPYVYSYWTWKGSSRFPGNHGPETSSFRNYFFAKTKSFTTNDAVCARDQKILLPEHIERDLLRITRKDNLKVFQALSWLEQNYFYLYDSFVQLAVAHCFLSSGLLYEALREERSLIHSLRSVVEKGLQFLGLTKEVERFFLLSLGVSIELIYKEVYPEELIGDRLKGYLEGLRTIDEELTISLRLIIQSEREELTDQEVSQVFALLLDLLRDDSKGRRSSLFYNQILGKFLTKFQGQITSEEVLQEICKSRAPQGTESLFDVKGWVGSFPLYHQGLYQLDVTNRSLIHKTKGKYEAGGWVVPPALSHTVLKKTGFDPSMKWEIESEKVSRDGTLKVTRTARGDCWERELEIGGKRRWYKLHTDSFGLIGPDIQKLFGEMEGVAFYIPNAREEGDPHLVIFSIQQDLPLYRIDSDGASFKMTSLFTSKKNMLSKVLNIKAQEEITPLLKRAVEFTGFHNVLCDVDFVTKEIEHLTISLSGTEKLEFTRGELGLESRTPGLEGFSLTTLPTLPEIYGLEGGLILQNQKGEVCLVLRDWNLYVEPGSSFSSLVLKRLQREGNVVYSPNRFFLYSLNSITGRFECGDNEGNLYLSYLYKLQRDYELAFFYLKKVEKMASFPIKSLLRFTKIADSSPESLAFNSHLFYRYIEALGVLSEKEFEKRKEPLDKEWGSWGMRAYVHYLRAISRDELSAIPRVLRLKKGEEKVLIQNLESYFSELPESIKIRYDLLTRAKGEMTLTILEKEVDPFPAHFRSFLDKPYDFIGEKSDDGSTRKNKLEKKLLYSSLEEYSYLVRIDEENLATGFHQLYHSARTCGRKGLHPFDLTLFMIIRCVPNSPLTHILFMARHFPTRFPKISDEQFILPEDVIRAAQEVSQSREYLNLVDSLKKEPLLFPYTNEIKLQYPTPPEKEGGVDVQDRQKNDMSPFQGLYTDLFTEKEESHRGILPTLPSHKQSPLDREIFQSYLEGANEIPETRVVTLFDPTRAPSVKEALLKREQELLVSLQKQRKHLLGKLQSPHFPTPRRLTPSQLEQELHFRLDTQTSQTLPILPETVMKEVILRSDPSYLAKHRPLLSEQERKEIVKEVLEYYHELLLYEMTRKASSLLEAATLEPENLKTRKELFALLKYEFPDEYNPYDFPEIPFFCIKSGKLPRPEQWTRYLWICEGIEKKENRLFQLMAGGGKTSFLTPLVMLRVKRKGFFPIFCSTQSIYPIDKENLHKTVQKLEDRLALLEIGMHVKLTAKDLKFIFNHLRIYWEEGRELIVTPQILYSLDLFYKAALIKEQDVEKVKWLSLILAFFEKRGFLILDESHRNLDALTRAIYGVGEVKQLPKHEIRLFIKMMKPLLGFEEVFCEGAKTVAQLGRLQENTQGAPTSQDLKQVRTALAHYMLSYLEVPEEDRGEFVAYWTSKRAEQPRLLRKWSEEQKEKADQAALIGYFLLSLLPQIVKMRTELDHAPSIYPEEEFDTPCYHKTPSTAQFEDPYRTIALSIKGTFHRGLTEKQLEILISKMIEKDREDKKLLPEGMETKAFGKFSLWMEGIAESEKLTLHNFFHETRKWNRVKEKLRRHPAVVEEYLTAFILKQIIRTTELLTSTPVDLLDMFPQSLCFSATPYFTSCYPRKIDTFSYDRPFEAQVVSRYCEPQNQEMIFPATSHLEKFFKWFTEAHPLLLQEIDVMIDPGGFFCDYTNREVVEEWLHMTDLDGAIYFEQDDGLSADRKERIILLLKTGGRLDEIPLQGGDWESVLRKKGMIPQDLRIGTYYDAAHTESADIPQRKEAKALLCAGDTLASSHLIQAIMRLRGFLDHDQRQTLVWCFQKDLAHKLSQDLEISGELIFAWSLKNEAKEMKKRVVLAAFQEISFHIEQIARRELKEALYHPEDQIKLMESHKNGFLQKPIQDPYLNFGEHEKLFPTQKVLRKFAEEEFARFGYSGSLDSYPELMELVQSVSKRASELVEKIASNFTQTISKEVEQQTQIQRDIEKEQYRPRPKDPRSAAQIFGDYGIEKPGYPKHSLSRRNSREVFKDEHLTEKLYFEKNQLRTANEGSIELWEEFLKPIDFFMIVCQEGKYWAEAVINEIQSTYKKTLLKEIVDPQITHSAFLLTSEGVLVQRGKGSLAPPPEVVEEVLGSQWLKDLVIDAALLKGAIRHPDRLQERIAQWPNFEEFWERIVKSLPNPEIAQVRVMKRIIKAARQASPQVQEEAEKG